MLRWTRWWTPVLLLLLTTAAPALGQSATKAEKLKAKGDYLFKTGYYFRASESYRLALLEDPSSASKKLAFGHALFAIGNYSYASYALRRGVAELEASKTFAPEVASLFPSRRRFTQALRDLKRYVTYSPRDPAGLTVLGYVLFSIRGEERRCRKMFRYLKSLDGKDPFASFFLKQLGKRGAKGLRRPAKVVQAPDHHVVFLNNFSTLEAARVKAALERDTEFKSVIPGGGSQARVVLEFSYKGKNLKVSVSRVLKLLGIRKFHFREATLPNHVEVYRLKEKKASAKKIRVDVVKRIEPKQAKPKKRPKPKPLDEVIPEPKRQREKLENDWPAPTPAPAR